MRIGAHVRAGGKLVPALERADEIGAEVVQVFTQSPRAWKPTQYAPEVLAGYRAAQAAHPTVSATYCHATYLINLATTDHELLARSGDCLVANLVAARGMGADGLVLHLGSHKGSGFDGCVDQVVDALLAALATAADPLASSAADANACPVLIENAAGAGGTMGRSFEELAAVLERAGAGPQLGICLDTQHLWASGVDFTSPERADAAIRALDDTVGLARLRCLHLNDSKVELGANRDRHANVGEGTIGAEGLGCLVAHPALDGLAAILEVPGAGDGPRTEEVAASRRALEAGRRRWKEAGSPGR
ncbi:MAG: deoxyribonuclease IV [Acidimicrobiales bacterium]